MSEDSRARDTIDVATPRATSRDATGQRVERPMVSPHQMTQFMADFEKGPKVSQQPGAESSTESDNSEANLSTEERVVAALKRIYDPEIPVDIYELGLIYGVDVDETNAHVTVTMTLTTPHCPVAETMPGEVEYRVSDVEGVKSAEVNLVWDPPWDMGKMSEEARLELGLL